MLGARAMALVLLKRFDEAADWGVKAATRPNAHAHILAIAAYCLALAGRRDEARSYMAVILKRVPGYHIDDFLTASKLAQAGAALFLKGARSLWVCELGRESCMERVSKSVELSGVSVIYKNT